MQRVGLGWGGGYYANEELFSFAMGANEELFPCIAAKPDRRDCISRDADGIFAEELLGNGRDADSRDADGRDADGRPTEPLLPLAARADGTEPLLSLAARANDADELLE